MVRRLFIAIMVGLTSACARWELPNPASPSVWKLPAPRLPADAVVVEVVFCRVRAPETHLLEDVWRATDEQRLDAASRKTLYRNGVRCGVVGQSLPPFLEQLVERQANSTSLADDDSQNQTDGLFTTFHRLQMRRGQRAIIQATPVMDSLTVLWTDGETPRGETFDQAQGVFSLRCDSLTDGTIRMDLVPEIEHGELRRRHIGSDGAWRLEFARDRKTYEPLRLRCALTPGEILLVTSTSEPKGLGKVFFVKESGDQLLLLIRVAQTQQDALFPSRSEGLELTDACEPSATE